MYECYGLVYARFNEATDELLLVSSEKTSIEFILDRIREELLQGRTVSVKTILCWNGDYDASEDFDEYIIDNVDEFDNTYVKRHKYSYISDEYVTTIQGIKRAPLKQGVFFFAKGTAIIVRILKGVGTMFVLFKRKPWPNGTISRKPEGKRYSDSWTTQPRTGRVTDEDIARYVIKHTHWWDRLDTHFVSDCVLEATDILWGYVKPPEGKWFFGKNYYGKWIEEDEWKKDHEFPHKDYEGSVDTIADVRFS